MSETKTCTFSEAIEAMKRGAYARPVTDDPYHSYAYRLMMLEGTIPFLADAKNEHSNRVIVYCKESELNIRQILGKWEILHWEHLDTIYK